MTLRLNGDSSGFTEIKAADSAGDNSIKLPASNGSANQLLQNGGTAGELQYTSAGGGLHYDSSGRLLVGTSVSPSTGFGQYANLVVQGYVGDNTASGTIAVARGALATTPLTDTDIGRISFTDSAGATFSSIDCYVDGTSGSNNHPGRLVFSTTANGAFFPTERMRITSDGYIRLSSDADGIQFNGDTAAANALDDYEEGTFTPTLSATSINVSYSVQDGFYTKIGRTVFFTLQINLSSVTSAGTGNFAIDGLPFAVNTGAYRYVIQTSNVDFDATKYSHYAYNPGGTVLKVLYTTDNGAWTVASTTNFAISSSSIISVTGFYKV